MFFCGYDIVGEDWDYCVIYGYGDGYFVEWNVVEEDFYIFNGIDCDICFVYVVYDVWVVRVVVVMGCEVEGDGEIFLICC